MDKKDWWQQWCLSRWKWWGMCFLVVMMSMMLPNILEVERTLEYRYSQLLLSVTGLGLMGIDGVQHYRRWKQLQRWVMNDSILLPTHSTATEQLLVQYIQHLRRQHNDYQQQCTVQAQEQLDYYTMWAHQIKTPITALSLLLDQISDNTYQPLCKQELFKIQQYTDYVLHYLRMETFHQDLVLRSESLDSCVRQTLKKYAPFFTRKSLSLEFEQCDLDIVTDAKWLSVVLEQLLSNALKYTPSGSIQLYVKDRTLYIQDTGIGIREADLERVFERGFTGFNGRMHQQSSGLGLYLCQKITQQLGIDLQLESEVGKGTLAKLTFPRTTRLHE